MIRPDLFLFGYRVFSFREEDVAEVARILLHAGISVRFVKSSFIAGEKKSKKIEALLATRVEFSKSELFGFGGFVVKNRSRYGVFAALAVTLTLFLISQNMVWDIRVEGCSEENSQKIVSELASCGFRIGTRWSSVELSDVEVDLLSSSETASWVNINRRGTVAYVTVVEKILHPEPEVKTGYANIVATCDAVIEEITVLKGVAMVKAGESVKRGDLLISGIISNEFGTEFCYAEGVVVGRISETFSVEVGDEEVKKEEKDRHLIKFTLKIFNFSINIINKYRNCDSECDIIDLEENTMLFGVRLPLVISKQYAVDYVSVLDKLDHKEMTLSAENKMALMLEEALSGSTLVRIRTEGAFSDNTYILRVSAVYLGEIGKDLSFEVVGK